MISYCSIYTYVELNALIRGGSGGGGGGGGSWGADDPPLPGLNILYQLAVLGSTASFATLPSTNEP